MVFKGGGVDTSLVDLIICWAWPVFYFIESVPGFLVGSFPARKSNQP